MIALSLLALGGCHVFDVVEIVCAANEPCARGDGGDADTDTDADTDADTDVDTDTGPVVLPSRGWVISGLATGGGRVIVFNSDAAQVAAWTDIDDANGPVAYDPVTGAAVLAYDGALYQLSADGTMKRAADPFPDALSVAFADNRAYVATGAGITTWFADDDTTDSVPFETTPLAGLVAVGLGPAGSVYASDTDGGAPDFYQWSVGSLPTSLYRDYDSSAARARIVFAGPEDAPYTCSEAGAIYAVSALAEGSSRPVVYYSGELTDVSACAYDPGDASWLIFSPTAGVVRLDAQSRSEVVLAPGSSYSFVRGAFY
ncbi:MAG: hypothetical protein Q8P41_05175 [Pseudomonadota bacterium]|nr:hypothetical protein [Pseudomonadota bacterium]